MAELPDEDADYLRSLGAGQPLVERAASAYRFWSRLAPNTVEDIFVSEYVNDAGERTFESLWLLAPEWVVEAHQFITEDRGDLVPLKRRLIRVEIERRNFELDQVTPDSRMTATVTFGAAGGVLSGTLAGTLKATGDNCLKLQHIVESYFMASFEF